MFAKRKELRKELIQLEKEINHEFLYNRYSHEDDYEIDLKTPNSFTIKRTRKRYHEKNVVN